MLVLSRKRGEKIIITDTTTQEQIVIVLVKAHYGKARIGIEADQRFTVMRPELANAKDPSNESNHQVENGNKQSI